MADPVNVEVVRARRALLDVLEALGAHSDSVVLVGAQAIYLRTGAAAVALAEFTTDADLAIDPRALNPDPLIEDAMAAGGFVRDTVNQNPGAWISAQGIPVDLMVPDRLAGEGRRGVTIPPHDRGAMRRTVGLEAAVVDNSVLTVLALDDHDDRRIDVRVASAAALLVAKLHKVNERRDDVRRQDDKDAHDIYRLLVATSTSALAESLEILLRDDVSRIVTETAVAALEDLFAAGPESLGSLMAGRAESVVGDPTQTAVASSILASDLLAALRQ